MLQNWKLYRKCNIGIACPYSVGFMFGVSVVELLYVPNMKQVHEIVWSAVQ